MLLTQFCEIQEAPATSRIQFGLPSSTPRTGTGAVAFNKLFHLFLCMQNRDNFTSAFHRAFGEALLFVQVI